MLGRLRRQVLFSAVGVLLLICLLLPAAALGAPAAAAPETAALLGLYQNETGRFLVRERDGQLEMLYDVAPGQDEVVREYAVYPLRLAAGPLYRWNGLSPFGAPTALLGFRRDGGGRGIACALGDKVFLRRLYGPETGETFKIKPLLSVAELRSLAAQAAPPLETGRFSEPDLVEVVALDPSIQLDIRYATDNNFMGMALYNQPRAFLQRPAAEALVRAHRALARYGYGILVHDAYRPWTVTKMFWEATPPQQRDFVADPSKGSRHNRGGAVDVALYDLSTQTPVAMISGYDEFSPRAYPDFPGGTSRQRWERDLLRIVMEGEGFTVYPEEWWHFDFQGWQQFRIMNVEFSEIH